MTHYSCAFNAQCEEDEYGAYDSLESCEAECTGKENREVTYLTLAYEPERALELSPSDQIRVVSELVGRRLPRAEARQLLLALRDHNVFVLSRYPELDDYLLSLAEITNSNTAKWLLDALRAPSNYETDPGLEPDDRTYDTETKRIRRLLPYPIFHPALRARYTGAHPDYRTTLLQEIRDYPTFATLKLLQEIEYPDELRADYRLMLRTLQGVNTRPLRKSLYDPDLIAHLARLFLDQL